VRVGDDLLALSGLQLIAIWGRWFCVEISQARHLCLVRSEQERYAPHHDAGSTEGGARERIDNVRAEVRGTAVFEFLISDPAG
jgi:hypothetical protein